MTPAREHAQAVDAVLRGRGSARPVTPQVRQSWARCRDLHILDPATERAPRFVAAGELQQRRRALDSAYDIARIEMAEISHLLEVPAGVMLTDVDGVILHYTGDPRFAAVARRSGFSEGAIWSEAEQGTNGMGTCLVARAPLVVDQAEHYLAQNASLICCAAPIADATGVILGALNVSGPPELSGHGTLALVRLAAQHIEDRLLLERFRGVHVLRFHPHRSFLTAPGEGLIAFAGDGGIVGINRRALGWLGGQDAERWIGQNLAEVLGLSLCTLLDADDEPIALPLTDGRTPVDALVRSPERRVIRQEELVPDRELLRDAERKALQALLARHQWNVTRAAAELGLSRKTLHRKLQRHRLERPPGA